MFASFSDYTSRKCDYEETNINQLESKVDSTLSSYSTFSNYIFEKSIVNNHVLQLFDEAYRANEIRQDIIRNELIDYFESDYQMLKEFDFRQVHFHFPDNTSFLRLHSPSKYGDDLTDIRYSVKTVNETGKYIEGFEEGRIFNGYRFVYPLNLNDVHIGSVEISISMNAVVQELSSLYKTDHALWVCSKTIKNTVWDDQIDNYIYIPTTKSYMMDEDAFNNRLEQNFTNEELLMLFESFNKNIKTKIENGESFSEQLSFKGTKYEVVFKQLNNIEGEKIGYFINIFEDNGFSVILTSELFSILIF